MENFVANIMAPSLLCGMIFIIAGVIMYKYPPKEINYLYGYRTRSAMQSQERWDFAQKFSAVLMIRGAVTLIVISLLAYFIPVTEVIKVVLGIVLIFLLSIYLFVNTEKAIKEKFKD